MNHPNYMPPQGTPPSPPRGVTATEPTLGVKDANAQPCLRPGPNFWKAMLAAQKAANDLPKKHHGPPNKKLKQKAYSVVDPVTGEVVGTEFKHPPMWCYVSGDQFVEEWRRVAALTDLMLVQVGEVQLAKNAQGGVFPAALRVRFEIVHAPSGEGRSYDFDFPFEPGDYKADALYTRAFSYFVRGVLQISRQSNQPIVEAVSGSASPQAGQQPSRPQQQQHQQPQQQQNMPWGQRPPQGWGNQ